MENVEQVARAGGCEHPIQLRGNQFLDNKLHWSTDILPGGIAYVACKTRRATVCEPCARLYKGDAYQLIVAGLRGDKGIADSVGSNTALFVTFTAPSFGPVHTQDRRGRCRPRRKGETCTHGISIACNERHRENDPRLGQPLCNQCFDYEAAVLWNANAGTLWRRTRIAIDRNLARLAGLTADEARQLVRIQYVKVAEFQKRGLVHFHVAIRLDGADGPPPPRFTVLLLREAISQAVSRTLIATPLGHMHWGRQLDVA